MSFLGGRELAGLALAVATSDVAPLVDQLFRRDDGVEEIGDGTEDVGEQLLLLWLGSIIPYVIPAENLLLYSLNDHFTQGICPYINDNPKYSFLYDTFNSNATDSCFVAKGQ